VGIAALVAMWAPPAVAYPGAPWFEPGKPYNQNFPDPTVLRVGDTYYAYATATGGSYLPVMTSTDLQTWTARPAYDPGRPLNKDPYFNDALPYPAAWGADRPSDSRLTKEVRSPGVARIGGRYVLYYTVLQQVSPPRYCISVAMSQSPLGPFTDSSSGPLVCDPDPVGSIDPEPFVDADGSAYLVWKSEGVAGQVPTRLWSRRLTADGLGFDGPPAVELLHTTAAWEGNVIENPSMVRFDGALILFYSGNEWASSSYATGYAACDSPLGPCTKQTVDAPLFASGGDRLGPGGASAFVDGGLLRVAYHWWNAPYTNYPDYPACKSQGTCTTQGQRRMSLATFEHVVRSPSPTTTTASPAPTPNGGPSVALTAPAAQGSSTRRGSRTAAAQTTDVSASLVPASTTTLVPTTEPPTSTSEPSTTSTVATATPPPDAAPGNTGTRVVAAARERGLARTDRRAVIGAIAAALATVVSLGGAWVHRRRRLYRL